MCYLYRFAPYVLSPFSFALSFSHPPSTPLLPFAPFVVLSHFRSLLLSPFALSPFAHLIPFAPFAALFRCLVSSPLSSPPSYSSPPSSSATSLSPSLFFRALSLSLSSTPTHCRSSGTPTHCSSRRSCPLDSLKFPQIKFTTKELNKQREWGGAKGERRRVKYGLEKASEKRVEGEKSEEGDKERAKAGEGGESGEGSEGKE